jgi:hypothetical protein
MYFGGVWSWRDNNNRQPLGEEWDFAVHASVYGKVQTKDNVHPNNQETRGKEGCFFLPELGCLATYVGYVPYVSVCLG